MTDWKIEEQTFGGEEYGPGRFVVNLASGVSLSIINAERNEYIRNRKQFSPSAILHGWEVTDVIAGDQEYEVAALNDEGEYDRRGLDPTPPGWLSHEDNHDGIVYGRMSAALINAYVNEVGLR